MNMIISSVNVNLKKIVHYGGKRDKKSKSIFI